VSRPGFLVLRYTARPSETIEKREKRKEKGKREKGKGKREKGKGKREKGKGKREKGKGKRDKGKEKKDIREREIIKIEEKRKIKRPHSLKYLALFCQL
jgi:hypothetical protein